MLITHEHQLKPEYTVGMPVLQPKKNKDPYTVVVTLVVRKNSEHPL